jgi:DNA-binding transcriptional regulator YhcF (GntR family)
MEYDFTDECRKVMGGAREEAIRLRHDYVGTEHILLGLARETQGVPAALLGHLKVGANEIRERIGESVKPGTSKFARGELPYTSHGKKVLEFAMAEARELNHAYIGAEHLLLGLLREERGIAAQVLTGLGVTLKAARREVGRLTGAHGSDASLKFEIDDDSDRSIYEQIVARVREAVATGEVRPGTRLPTVRRLADELDIAPGTVARSYSELERLGVVVTDGARGTRVADRVAAHDGPSADATMLVGLLRPTVVAAFHMGADARNLRAALEDAMKGIFEGDRGIGTGD